MAYSEITKRESMSPGTAAIVRKTVASILLLYTTIMLASCASQKSVVAVGESKRTKDYREIGFDTRSIARDHGNFFDAMQDPRVAAGILVIRPEYAYCFGLSNELAIKHIVSAVKEVIAKNRTELERRYSLVQSDVGEREVADDICDATSYMVAVLGERAKRQNFKSVKVSEEVGEAASLEFFRSRSGSYMPEGLSYDQKKECEYAFGEEWLFQGLFGSGGTKK